MSLIQHSANQLVLKEDERNAINQDKEFEREFLGFKTGKHAMRNSMTVNLLLDLRSWSCCSRSSHCR